MTEQAGRDMIAKENKQISEHDAYNTVSTGDVAVFDEMISGHIKYDGTEAASDLDGLKSQMPDDAVVTVASVA